jgi:hypothetical protein
MASAPYLVRAPVHFFTFLVYLSGLQNIKGCRKGFLAARLQAADVLAWDQFPACGPTRPGAIRSDKERPEVPASDVAKCLGNMYGAG